MAERHILADRRLKIRPGAPVISGGEQVGRVQQVIYRPDSDAVQGIIVAGGAEIGHDVYVPIDAIESADDDAVRTSLSAGELRQLAPAAPAAETPAETPAETSEPDANPDAAAARSGLLRPARGGQMPALAGGHPLRAGQRVMATDGEAGRLDLVMIDPRTGRATGFVVRKGILLTRDVIVPVEWVRSVERDAVILSVPRAKLDRLPEYRPDEEITRDVLDELWYGARLKPGDVQFVEVQTRDGIVELTGHTHTREQRRRIEEVVRSVPGVIDVRNYLDTFEDLEAAIREAQLAARRRGTSPTGPSS